MTAQQSNNATQRSPAWHQARKNRVTGSIAGAILGHAPYMTRDEAMRSMVRAYHDAPSEFVGGPHIGWGVNMEPEAVAMFELESGLQVKEVGFFEYEDWAGASPDGECSDGHGLEVKCPFGLRKDAEPQFKTAHEQPHYYDQMQVEILATGWDGMWFYQWAPNGTCLEFVRRDQEWIDENLHRLRQFHAEYLHERDNNKDDHCAPKRKEINTEEACMLIAEWDDMCEAEDRAKERKKEIMERLSEISGGKDALIDGRKFTKITREGSVSYARVVKDHCKDIDLDPYRGKQSEYWKLT